MKNWKGMVWPGLLCGVVFFASVAAVHAEPVAPMFPMKKQGIKLVQSQGKTLEDLKNEIPSKAEVGVPVYPGVHYASETAGSGSEMLPAVNLVSADPPDVVTAWYKENLDGWSYDEMYQIFYKGEGEVDMGSLMKMQTITVVSEDGSSFDLMYYNKPELKTRIIIRYQPNQ